MDILIIDDESGERNRLSNLFANNNFQTRTAKNLAEAVDEIGSMMPYCLIIDTWLENNSENGMDLLKLSLKKYPEVPVIMMTGHGNVETADSARKIGAYDCIDRPFSDTALLHLVKRAIRQFNLKEKYNDLKKSSEEYPLMGSSKIVRDLIINITKAAKIDSNVLITGEYGVEKTSVAVEIHKKSKRSKEPFLVFNASSGMSESDIELELFGNAHMDNDQNNELRKVGLMERAANGILVLEEIQNLPISTQEKLLHYVQDHTIERTDDHKHLSVNIRVIATTSKDINEQIKQGYLLHAFVERLQITKIDVPSLFQRREDIPLMCEYFLNKIAVNSDLPVIAISEDSIVALQSFNWPGNIRQLRNVLEWLMMVAVQKRRNEITSDMLPRDILTSTPASIVPSLNNDIMSKPLREARMVFEQQYIKAQLERFGGNISHTAKFIGMERTALHRKLEMLGIDSDGVRSSLKGYERKKNLRIENKKAS